MASQPRFRAQGAIASGRWSLLARIDSSVSLYLIGPSDSALIHQTLRDYRNFIHPMKEIRAQQAVGQNEGGLAVNALNLVIDHLQATFTP